MIICSCNVISDHAIRQVAGDLKAKNPHHPLVPDMIFKALGYQPKCGTCIASIMNIIQEDEAGDHKLSTLE